MFKTKRNYLNFVTHIKGDIRLHTKTAYIDGNQLSGILEGNKFRITILDDKTIDFEEVDGLVTDKDLFKRLIEDIDEMSLTPYAHKYVIFGLKFKTEDDKLCYLETEEKRPIDKLASLFEDRKVSSKELSLIDQLLSKTNDPVEEVKEEVEMLNIDTDKSTSTSYLEEQFKLMNESKIKELKQKIDNNIKENIKLKMDISVSEKKLKKNISDLSILEDRLESFNVNDEPNGYVFNISEVQKEDIEISEDNDIFLTKISEILKLKKDVLLKNLTNDYYIIKVSKSNDYDNTELDTKILRKITELSLIDEESEIHLINNGEFKYTGKLDWHQLVDKMLRKGFSQDSEFDKLCGSNSYEVK
jgi:hypothetical protein